MSVCIRTMGPSVHVASVKSAYCHSVRLSHTLQPGGGSASLCGLRLPAPWVVSQQTISRGFSTDFLDRHLRRHSFGCTGTPSAKSVRLGVLRDSHSVDGTSLTASIIFAPRWVSATMLLHTAVMVVLFTLRVLKDPSSLRCTNATEMLSCCTSLRV